VETAGLDVGCTVKALFLQVEMSFAFHVGKTMSGPTPALFPDWRALGYSYCSRHGHCKIIPEPGMLLEIRVDIELICTAIVSCHEHWNRQFC